MPSRTRTLSRHWRNVRFPTMSLQELTARMLTVLLIDGRNLEKVEK